MTIEKKILLMTQSYREAKEAGIVSRLEPIGIVTGYCDANLNESPFCDRVIEVANSSLERKAREKSADYVFGMDYHVYEREKMRTTFVSGDAYRNNVNSKKD